MPYSNWADEVMEASRLEQEQLRLQPHLEAFEEKRKKYPKMTYCTCTEYCGGNYKEFRSSEHRDRWHFQQSLKKETRHTMLVFSNDTPSLLRLDTHGDDGDDTAFILACLVFGPILFALCFFGLANLATVFIPGSDGQANLWQASTAMPFFIYGGYGVYAWRRRHYVVGRTRNAALIAMEHKFWTLPADIRAEIDHVRMLAYKYHKLGDEGGMERCLEVVSTGGKVVYNRELTEVNVEAKPALDEALKNLGQYQEETKAMYAGELTSGQEE
jgi:hypothetical protein